MPARSPSRLAHCHGFTPTFSVSGQENICAAVETMQFEYKPTAAKSGFIFPPRSVAMIATPNPLPMFEHGFLMGCNSNLSANCFPLVPGDFAAQHLGAESQ